VTWDEKNVAGRAERGAMEQSSQDTGGQPEEEPRPCIRKLQGILDFSTQ